MWNLKHLLGGSVRRLGVGALALAAGTAAWVLSTAVSAGSDPASSATAAGSSQMVRLTGHVHGLAQARFDIGEAPDSLRITSLELVLSKSAAQEAVLKQLLAAQHDPKSAQYHQWLTPAQFGARFGASETTVAALTQWLEANGFQVDGLPASRSWLRFHGTKAQVEATFHTEIHLFEVGGVKHFANVSDPEVPAELAPLIAAIQGLHDFYLTSSVRTLPLKSVHPQTTYNGGTNNYIGPTDFATIYNLLPLYQAGDTGKNVTIAIVGASDINATTASAYWTGFGLSSTPTFSSIPVPAGAPYNGQDPGQTNDNNENEAYLDVEIAGGLAPGATILLVRDVNVFNAATYIIDKNLGAILNISFGACESSLGSSNASIRALFQQGASQGITITVSAGDSGAAGCATDFTQGTLSTTGFAVNGVASTPYNLAVGGTDFDPTQQGDWASGNAPGTLANALTHIPEMVWNDSCANPLWAQYQGFASTLAFCNTTTLMGSPNPYIEVAGGGGGLSNCSSVSGANCTGGYPQPAWQSGVAGIQGPNAWTRAVPDVSIMSNNWLACAVKHATTCDPSTASVDLFEGTSAAAPAVAAIIALLDQEMSTAASPDGRQGLINTQLYPIGATEYGSPQSPNGAASACSASLGNNIGAACVFYNVTAGNNDEPCQVSGYSPGLQSSSCTASGAQTNGIMEISSTPEYQAASGFNLATGLGSINAANLVLAIYLPAPSGLAASSSGQSVNLTWTGEPHATSFNIYQGSQPGQEGSSPVQTGATGTSATVSGLQFGQTFYFTITAQSALGVSTRSNEALATIVPAAPLGLSATGGNGTVNLTWSATPGASTYSVYQGTSAGGEAVQPAKTSVSGTTTQIAGLNNGATYYFKVAAVDAGGTSAQSNEAQATTVPAAPTGLSATAGNGTVNLTWSAATGTTSYNVYQGTSAGGEAAQPVQTQISGTSIAIGGLSNGTTYYFKVAGVDAGGASPVSAEAMATPVAPPSGGGGGTLDLPEVLFLALFLGWRIRRSRHVETKLEETVLGLA